ncbi:hypothetical protein A6A04_17395 [Paramagnetospirillum marisnigri]|uniref:Chemotaxis protein n=1 Tax=Paramagnetospirillum marisnigri TaxID=1285242 RepID=A0A178MRJ5_9PROT|nr:methyl-accepting chemotaxis protein [Paramagnetospirillum marisnigri]OAN50728.1 hypothetical protein A6A04_17395 [Paramagnetospirillum marisnigri]
MFTQLRIGPRLAVLVATMILVLVVCVGIGHWAMGRINHSLGTVYDDRTVPLVQLGNIERALFTIQTSLPRAWRQDGSDIAGLKREIAEKDQAIDAEWKAYMATYLTPEEKGIAADIEHRLATYRGEKQRVMAMIEAGDMAAARAQAIGPATEAFNLLDKALVADIALQDRVAREEHDNGEQLFIAASTANLIIAGLGLALSLVLALSIVRSITVPVRTMVAAMTELAGGNTNVEVPGSDRVDEIGDMAKSVDVFKRNAIERNRLEAEELASRRRREARQVAMETMSRDFDKAVSDLLKDVSEAARHMRDTARAMTANAEETQRQSAAVSAATGQASANVSTIAAASNQLVASINEISIQVSRAAAISSTAASDATATNDKMSSLADAASRIGEVVRLISDIASQTNLLALNATIEAARAGDAGKGFAVVANEVKHLANQTAKATEEIANQIGAIQTETIEAVDSIRRITSVIGEISEMSSAIAGAVEEQGAAMQEVVRNVEQAAIGTEEVARNITQVVDAADNTGRMAAGVEAAAGTLSGQSETLRGSVETFLSGVKAA